MKSITISLRMSKDEYEDLKQKSNDRGMSVSDYIRNKISQQDSFGIKDKQVLCGGLTRIKDGLFNNDLDNASEAVDEICQLLRL